MGTDMIGEQVYENKEDEFLAILCIMYYVIIRAGRPALRIITARANLMRSVTYPHTSMNADFFSYETL